MDQLFEVIALLRAAEVVHQHAHWVTRGPSFVGDHSLFADLYKPLNEQYDTLAQKAVMLFGDGAVNPVEQMQHVHNCVAEFCKEPDLIQRSLDVERELQAVFKTAVTELEGKHELPMGLDNFLRGLADSHEDGLYQLRQRAMG